MAVISVRVEKSGRVLIPVTVRRQLGLKEGESDLLLDIHEQPIRVTTRAQVLGRLQELASRYGTPWRTVERGVERGATARCSPGVWDVIRKHLLDASALLALIRIERARTGLPLWARRDHSGNFVR